MKTTKKRPRLDILDEGYFDSEDFQRDCDDADDYVKSCKED